MYKNLSEIEALKKGLWSNLVVSKKRFFLCSLRGLITGNSFFQSTEFRYFTKVVVAIHASMSTVFILEEHLQPRIAYIQCIW